MDNRERERDSDRGVRGASPALQHRESDAGGVRR